MFSKVPTARAKQNISSYLKEKNFDINYSFFCKSQLSNSLLHRNIMPVFPELENKVMNTSPNKVLSHLGNEVTKDDLPDHFPPEVI